MFAAMLAPKRNPPLALLSPAVCLALLLAVPSQGSAQRAGSRGDSDARDVRSYGSAYLPLGHWAYGYVDMLIARGRITSLPPLVRPYRRIDVAAAVLAAEAEGQLSRAEMEWTAVLAEELAEEIELLRGRRSLDVGLGGEFAVGFMQDFRPVVHDKPKPCEKFIA